MADILENPVDLIDDAYEQEIQVEQEPIEVTTYRSYNRLDDKPQINGIELIGNKTSSDLGITAQINSAVNSEAQTRQQADSALQGEIDAEELARQQADSTLQGKIDAEETARKAADKDIQDVIDGETLARQNADTALGGRIDTEIHDRQVADIGLQGQIDAITSKSDVVDVVATYAALQAYDTQHLGDNDVIKVLDDETHNDAQTYYRWNKTAGTWSYIGSEAPYYSKGQIDQQMQAKQDKLTAGTGINLNGSTISADTTVLATKEDLEPEIVADLPAVGDTTKLYLTPTNKTASGNPITIDLKEDVGQITSFQLDGDTFQQTYTGKNLYEWEDVDFSSSTTSSSWCFQDGATGAYGANITSKTTYKLTLPSGAYYLSAYNVSSNIERINLCADGDSAERVLASQDGSFYLSEETVAVIRYRVTNPSLGIGNTKIQLELGSAATSYEPYVGGQPSPNPDYPQPIQTVTGRQVVKVEGKNLWGGFASDFSRTGQGVSYINKADGTIFANGTSSGNALSLLSADAVSTGRIITLQAGDYVLSGGTSTVLLQVVSSSGEEIAETASDGVKAFTLSEATGIFVRARMVRDTVADNVAIKPMLEKGSTASAYAPYHATDYPLDLGSIELCKIGTYKDYIYKDGDSWKVHKALGKITLNGSEDWYGAGGNAPFSLAIDGALITTSDNNPPLVYCDKFYPVSQNASWSAYDSLISTSTTSISTNTIRIRYTAMANLSAFRTWLGSNNTTLYYVVATATDTTITDTNLIAQLEAIRTAAFQNGANTITNTATGANLAGSMSIGYYGYNPSEYSEWLYVDGTWEQVGGRPFPTNISEFNNDANFVSENELQDIIAPKLQTEIVNELPAQGNEGKLYLTPKAHTTQTATGNPITATVAEEAGKIESLKLDGDTFQQTYTGKNLFNADTETLVFIDSSGNIIAGSTWSSSDYIKVSPNTTYAWHGEQTGSSGGQVIWAGYDSSQAFISGQYAQVNNTAGTSFTTGASTEYVRVGYRNDRLENMQLELGSASSYEPFVGGTPSPNPDYPQPIQTVTGLQTISINGTDYPLDLGKNLFNKDNYTDADGYYIGSSGRYSAASNNHTAIIPIEPNTTYTVSKTAQATYNRLRVGISDTLASAGDYFPIWGGSDTATEVTLTSGSNSRYMYIYYAVTINVSDAIASLMLEKGATATTYAPYKTPIELCKLGTYQDYIWKDGEDWKLHKATGQIVFDSSTPWFKHPTTGGNIFLLAGTGFIGYRYNIGQVAPAKMNTDRVTALESGMDGSYGLAGITDDSQLRVFRGEYDSAYTAQIFNEQMVGNYIYGALVTPTDTTITDSTLIAQLEAIRTASLQNGANTITNSATGSNLAGDMEIGYYGFAPRNRYDKWLWLDINNEYEQIGS